MKSPEPLTPERLAEIGRRAQVEAVRACLAEVWDEAAEATAEWMANNPGPSSIPHDPPSNPYLREHGSPRGGDGRG